MLETILILLVIVGVKGYSTKIVVDAGSDMPYFVSNALRRAGVIPYEIPVANIIKSMFTKSQERLTPNWLDIYVK